MPKILVIEDQEAPWDNFLLCLTQICKVARVDIDRARYYTEAEKMIGGTTQYDLIFLDHRMPHDDPGCTDINNFERFCQQLDNIGYGLLPLLAEAQPKAFIVGTSSLHIGDIGRYAVPELCLNKVNMFDELPPLMEALTIAQRVDRRP